MASENSLSKRIEFENMGKLVEYGINMSDITTNNCLILKKIFRLFFNSSQIQFHLMLIGVRILNIEGEMKLQKHNHKRKDWKYFKERTKR